MTKKTLTFEQFADAATKAFEKDVPQDNGFFLDCISFPELKEKYAQGMEPEVVAWDAIEYGLGTGLIVSPEWNS